MSKPIIRRMGIIEPNISLNEISPKLDDLNNMVKLSNKGLSKGVCRISRKRVMKSTPRGSSTRILARKIRTNSEINLCINRLKNS